MLDLINPVPSTAQGFISMFCQTFDFSGTFARIVHVGRLAIHDRAGLEVAATDGKILIETIELRAARTFDRTQ